MVYLLFTFSFSLYTKKTTMNKPLLGSLILLLAFNWLPAQTPNYHWATKFDADRNDDFGFDSDDQFVVDAQGNSYLEQIGAIHYDNGGFYPLKLIPQADGSVLLFGEASEETTLSDDHGFSYTTGPLIEGSSLEDIYLVIKYTAQGQVLWIRELHGEYAEAQLVADAQGHTYLMGYLKLFCGGNSRPYAQARMNTAAFCSAWMTKGKSSGKKSTPMLQLT